MSEAVSFKTSTKSTKVVVAGHQDNGNCCKANKRTLKYFIGVGLLLTVLVIVIVVLVVFLTRESSMNEIDYSTGGRYLHLYGRMNSE